MHLRSFCLSIGLLLSSVPLLAATLPLAPQVLSSQLRIDRHDMAITTEDWHWLRHKAELKVGVYATECAPFSVYAQDNLYEGISADATALVAQLLGLQVKVVPFANEQDARKALQAGSVDVISIHGSTEPRPDLFDLLDTECLEGFAAQHRGTVTQLQHQQIAVLQQLVDIQGHCPGFCSCPIHERNTAKSSSWTSPRVLGT